MTAFLNRCCTYLSTRGLELTGRMVQPTTVEEAA